MKKIPLLFFCIMAILISFLETSFSQDIMQIGFLSRTPRGRCVTPMGYRHLGIAAPGEENGDQLKLDF